MSEIIWAMNSRFDDLENLMSYIRRFAHQFLNSNELELSFTQEGSLVGVNLSGEKRRNLFLVVKEILHNVVKHSEASRVDMVFHIDNLFVFEIKDDGIGMEESTSLFGNGLKNMKDRITNLGGILEVSSNDGTAIKVKIPMEKLINI